MPSSENDRSRTLAGARAALGSRPRPGPAEVPGRLRVMRLHGAGAVRDSTGRPPGPETGSPREAVLTDSVVQCAGSGAGAGGRPGPGAQERARGNLKFAKTSPGAAFRPRCRSAYETSA